MFELLTKKLSSVQVYDKPMKLVCSVSSCIYIYYFFIATLGVIKKNYVEKTLKYIGPEASFKTLFQWRTNSSKLHIRGVCFHTDLKDKTN